MKKLNREKFIRGVTLVEILLAAGVLAILSTSAFFGARGRLREARDAKRKSDLNRIKIALYDYLFDNDCFPEEIPACGQNLKAGEAVYLNNFPCDPLGKSYVYQADDNGCSQKFKVLTNLEDIKDKDIAAVGCQNGCGPQCQYNYGVSSSNIKVNEGCVVTPTPEPGYIVCAPGNTCDIFMDPAASQCPKIFFSFEECQKECFKEGGKVTKGVRCQDSKGKFR